MKLLILAAGQGTRLGAHTAQIPKCMAVVAGAPIIEWQIGAARSAGIDEIAVVTGHCAGRLPYRDVTYFHNDRYAETNMVESLWCAHSFFDEACIVSYGDIICERDVFVAMVEAPHPIAVAVDTGWHDYWRRRFENVLDDAETLMMDDDGRIREIGQPAETLRQIEGQYIGLIKFQGEGVASMRSLYERLHAPAGRCLLRTDRPLDNIYMTDFLQAMVDDGLAVAGVTILRKWLEVDTPRDLAIAEELLSGEPARFSIRD